jgi:hypothetical protein
MTTVFCTYTSLPALYFKVMCTACALPCTALQRYTSLTFIDFLEALGRVADMKSLPLDADLDAAGQWRVCVTYVTCVFETPASVSLCKSYILRPTVDFM